MIPLALNDASTDARLHGAEVRLLVYLYGQLIQGEYRTLKLWPIARAVRMNKATVGRSMAALTRFGYLREGPRQEHGGRSFMLVPVLGDAAKRIA